MSELWEIVITFIFILCWNKTKNSFAKYKNSKFWGKKSKLCQNCKNKSELWGKKLIFWDTIAKIKNKIQNWDIYSELQEKSLNY